MAGYPVALNLSPLVRVCIAFVISAVIILAAATGSILVLCRRLQGGTMHLILYHVTDFLSHVLFIPILGTFITEANNIT